MISSGATLYVDAASLNPSTPYISWATASTNIQDAIDAAVNGDEVVVTNGIYGSGGRVMSGNPLVNHGMNLNAVITGRASRLEWYFGERTVITNLGFHAFYTWTNAGYYIVTCTAFNADHPSGVTANLSIHVSPLLPPLLENANGTNNQFSFSFAGQSQGSYTIQYATDLNSPISWRFFQSFISTGQVHQVIDPAASNATRFYRVVGH